MNHTSFLLEAEHHSGFEPVYVSWSCVDDWKRGMSELYYHPKHLDIAYMKMGSSGHAARENWARCFERGRACVCAAAV